MHKYRQLRHRVPVGGFIMRFAKLTTALTKYIYKNIIN